MCPKWGWILCACFCASLCQNITFRNITLLALKPEPLIGNPEEEIFVESSTSLKNAIDAPYNLTSIIAYGEIPVLYENSVVDISNVESIYFNNVSLRRIKEGAFRNLTLNHLGLKYNNLTHIKKNVFSSLQVQHLDLSNNKIFSIHARAFNSMPKLQVFDVSWNNLRIIKPKWFKNSDRVHKLFFGHNQIVLLRGKAFKHLNNSEDYPLTVGLEDNNIGEVGWNVFQAKFVDILNLDGNSIRDWHANTLQHVENINELKLSFNIITHLHGDLEKILKAKITYLDNNPLAFRTRLAVEKWMDGHPNCSLIYTPNH